MAANHTQRQPTFLWQAVLILLPIAALAAVGVASLHRDQIQAEREATARAQTIADDLVSKVWDGLVMVKGPDQLKQFTFQIDAAGQLVSPPPMDAMPLPKPFDQGELTAAQPEWARCLYAAARPHFQAKASKNERGENHTETTNRLLSVRADNQPGAVLPHVFWFTTEENWKTVTPSNAVNPVAFVIEDRDWLATRFDDNTTSHWFVCRAGSTLDSEMSELMHHTKHIPEYFGIGIEVAGKKLAWYSHDLQIWRYHHYGGKGGHVDKEFLSDVATNALASATKLEAGSEALKVSVYLTSPTAFFESQRIRVFWFLLLIATAAGTALFGLFAAWGAFSRQQRLNEMKSNFVASVSHELRAPVASVRLLAESLERGSVSEPQKQNEYFRFIGQECRRLSALIENVLDFSRIEQGRKQYEFEPTDMVALVQQTVTLMAPYATEKGVKLNAECGVESAELNVDGRAIQQALVNLIDNAVKHSPQGEIVTVGLTPDALQVTLFVGDHGPGVPPEEREKIFERFYRLGSESRRETQGVGIGLSIVKHVVEAHGGRVRVESEPGRGSRFVIELPRVPQISNHDE